MRSRTRLLVMAAVAVMVAAATGVVGAWSFAPLAGWDAAAVVFSSWTWVAIASMNAAQTSTHATREDPGRAQTDLIVVLAAVASLAAVGAVLITASSGKGGAQDALAGFGVFSVALSWFTVHTLFALRYARLYYLGSPGGIDFNQKTPPPRYLDFATWPSPSA